VITRRLIIATSAMILLTAITRLSGAGRVLGLDAPAGDQTRSRGFGREAPPSTAGRVEYDGRFTFVRLKYTMDSGGFLRGFGRRGGEPMWAHDYPRGDSNFMKILNEITYLAPHLEDSNILGLDDPRLFQYPIAYMAEPGFWTMTDEEAASFRAYLLKGGFAIFDDFRGPHWYNFEEQMRRVLPDARWIELDGPEQVFHSFFEIERPHDFIPPYNQELKPIFYGIFEDNDPAKRLMVVANYNNDISEYWEYSDTGFYAIDLSNDAYKIGVNYIIYAMTH
jgi:uncharacterized protein DUF4159